MSDVYPSKPPEYPVSTLEIHYSAPPHIPFLFFKFKFLNYFKYFKHNHTAQALEKDDNLKNFVNR